MSVQFFCKLPSVFHPESDLKPKPFEPGTREKSSDLSSAVCLDQQRQQENGLAVIIEVFLHAYQHLLYRLQGENHSKGTTTHDLSATSSTASGHHRTILNDAEDSSSSSSEKLSPQYKRSELTAGGERKQWSRGALSGMFPCFGVCRRTEHPSMQWDLKTRLHDETRLISELCLFRSGKSSQPWALQDPSWGKICFWDVFVTFF